MQYRPHLGDLVKTATRYLLAPTLALGLAGCVSQTKYEELASKEKAASQRAKEAKEEKEKAEAEAAKAKEELEKHVALLLLSKAVKNPKKFKAFWEEVATKYESFSEMNTKIEELYPILVKTNKSAVNEIENLRDAKSNLQTKLDSINVVIDKVNSNQKSIELLIGRYKHEIKLQQQSRDLYDRYLNGGVDEEGKPYKGLTGILDTLRKSLKETYELPFETKEQYKIFLEKTTAQDETLKDLPQALDDLYKRNTEERRKAGLENEHQYRPLEEKKDSGEKKK